MPDDLGLAADRRRLADRNGWLYTEHDQRIIHGWPRPVLPPGRIGGVRNVLSGSYRGSEFTVFDYFHVPSGTHQWETLTVHTMALPAEVPYVEISDPEGGAHDLYAQSPEPRFPVELLSDEVRETIRRHAFTAFVLDGDLLICTSSGGGPEDVEAKLDAMADLLSEVSGDLWTRWDGVPAR